MDMLKDFYNFIHIDMVRAGFEDFKELVLIIPFAVLVGAVYWLVRRIMQRKKYSENFARLRHKCRLNETLRLLFVIYTVTLFSLTLLPSGIFEKLLRFLAYEDWFFPPYDIRIFDPVPEFVLVLLGRSDFRELFSRNVVLNTALFVPFGVLLPFIWEKSGFLKTNAAGAIISFAIEIIQIFIMRDPDIDDIICNTIGTIIGYLIYIAVKKLFPKLIEKNISFKGAYQILTKNDKTLPRL